MKVPSALAAKYRFEGLLGEGGMGVVHAAHHLELNSRVAIKVLQPKLAADANAQARFLREARLAASIEGDHSTRIYDVGADENGVPYMVMEYLAGESVDARLQRDGVFTLKDAATIMMQVLGVLAEAHARGLVHRDLKPANLFLVDRVGEAVWVKVMDFGISKIASSSGDAIQTVALTEPRTLLGSPHYMSPEQLRDSATVDARADLWACGVVLFELLSGRPPFVGETLADLYAQVISAEPPKLADVCKEPLPDDVSALVARCLEKEPAKRPASAFQIAQILAPFASESARALLPRVRAWSVERDPSASLPPPPASPEATGAASPLGATVDQRDSVAASSAEPRPWFQRRSTWAGLALVAGASFASFSFASRSAPPPAKQEGSAVPPMTRIERVTDPVPSANASVAPTVNAPSRGELVPQPLERGNPPERGKPPSSPPPKPSALGQDQETATKNKKKGPGRIQGIDSIELIP